MGTAPSVPGRRSTRRRVRRSSAASVAPWERARAMRAASMLLVLALALAQPGRTPASAQGWGARLEVRAAEAALRAPDAATRARAARWLGRHARAERAVGPLSSALEVETSAEVRAALIRALCRLGSDAAIPALAEQLGREEGETLSRAVDAAEAILGNLDEAQRMVAELPAAILAGNPVEVPVPVRAKKSRSFGKGPW